MGRIRGKMRKSQRKCVFSRSLLWATGTDSAGPPNTEKCYQHSLRTPQDAKAVTHVLHVSGWRISLEALTSRLQSASEARQQTGERQFALEAGLSSQQAA